MYEPFSEAVKNNTKADIVETGYDHHGIQYEIRHIDRIDVGVLDTIRGPRIGVKFNSTNFALPDDPEVIRKFADVLIKNADAPRKQRT